MRGGKRFFYLPEGGAQRFFDVNEGGAGRKIEAIAKSSPEAFQSFVATSLILMAVLEGTLSLGAVFPNSGKFFVGKSVSYS